MALKASCLNIKKNVTNAHASIRLAFWNLPPIVNALGVSRITSCVSLKILVSHIVFNSIFPPLNSTTSSYLFLSRTGSPQELMGLPPSFVCLVEFHLISYLMLDYQQYMMLYIIVKNWDKLLFVEVTENVFSQIMASKSHTHVLGHSHQESPTLF